MHKSFWITLGTLVMCLVACLAWIGRGVRADAAKRPTNPQVAHFQEQLKTVNRGDLIRTADGKNYFVVHVHRDSDGASLNTKSCIDCETYWFNAQLLVERGAEIVHRGDEHYAAGLDQFAQSPRK